MAIFNLTLKGPIHQGEFVGINREAALDWVPSDTLFAALVATWASHGEPVKQLLEDFVSGAPPFRLTSAFPRAGAVRFYPAPARYPARLYASGMAAKTLKKVHWSKAVSHLPSRLTFCSTAACGSPRKNARASDRCLVPARMERRRCGSSKSCRM